MLQKIEGKLDRANNFDTERKETARLQRIDLMAER